MDKDLFFTMLSNISNGSEMGSIPVIFLMGGIVVHGRVVSHASVMRDMLIGLNLSETKALETARIESEQGIVPDDILSLSEVTIYMSNQMFEIPFLRVRESAIDGWFSGGKLVGKSLLRLPSQETPGF